LYGDAKPALAGGGKKLAADVAGSRSRRCFGVAGFRSDPYQSRTWWTWP